MKLVYKRDKRKILKKILKIMYKNEYRRNIPSQIFDVKNQSEEYLYQFFE